MTAAGVVRLDGATGAVDADYGTQGTGYLDLPDAEEAPVRLLIGPPGQASLFGVTDDHTVFLGRLTAETASTAATLFARAGV